MKKKMIFLPFLFVGFVVLFIWGFMHLWNWIMPLVFGLTILSFWQAAGLLLISKILFGGFIMGRGRGCCNPNNCHKGGWKHKFKQKWGGLSDEEKRRWESKFGRTCGNESSPTENSKLDQPGE